MIYKLQDLSKVGVNISQLSNWRIRRIFDKLDSKSTRGNYCFEEVVFLLLLTRMNQLGFDLKKFRGHPERFGNYPIGHYQAIKDSTKMVLSSFGEKGIGLKVYAAIYESGFVSYWQGTANFDMKEGEDTCFVVNLTSLICRVHPDL